MDEKIRFIEEKRIIKTAGKELQSGAESLEESLKESLKPELKGVTNPIRAGLLKFSSSKYKFNLKDI